MAQGPYPVEASEAAWRVFSFFLVDATDGRTPETGEAAGQPQVSKNGGAWGNTSDTLHAVGNGHYYITLTVGEVDTIGSIAIRYKSANTCEFQDTARVVAWDMMSAYPAVDFTTVLAAIDTRAEPGDQMDLIGTVNNTAVYRIQAGLAAPGDKMDLVNAVIVDISTSVWNFAARELTSFGSLVTSIVTGVWGAASRTITGFGGGGTSVLTLTVRDGTTAVVGDVPVFIFNAGGQLLAQDWTNSATGVYATTLSDGTYTVYLGPMPGRTFSNPYTVTVSGATAATLTIGSATVVPGGLTFDAIRSAVDLYVRRTYGDGDNFVGASLRDMWINTAYQQVDTWLRWTRQTYVLNTVDGDAEYTWPAGVHEVLSAELLTAANELSPVMQIGIADYTTKRVAQTSAYSTGLTSAPPSFFCIHGQSLYLYPTPSDSTNALTFYTVLGPGNLVDGSDMPGWPADMHSLVIDLAMAHAAFHFGDPATAEAMRQSVHTRTQLMLKRESSDPSSKHRVNLRGI